MLKKTLIISYIVVVAVMAIATFVEKLSGTRLYGEWWFSLLWALLTAAGLTWLLKQRVRRPSVVTLHLGFVVILAGALLTRLFSEQGIIHIREGETAAEYLTDDALAHELPFTLRLDTFAIRFHPGTRAAADYESHLTLTDGSLQTGITVSMNNIYSHGGYRLYQMSYDEDLRGTVLSVNSDPWGIPVTYCGYALLFCGLIWMLIDPKGSYRRIASSPLLKRGLLSTIVIAAPVVFSVAAPRTFPKETAERFGNLCVVYNDRVCPLQTYALDFTKKLSGQRRYGAFSAEQVLAGFIFFKEDWDAEPLIKVKGEELKQALHLGVRASVNDFFGGDYLLGPYLMDYRQGAHEGVNKQAAQMDDRLMVVMELQQGTPLKVFPFTLQGETTWYSPVDEQVPEAIPMPNRLFMGTIFQLLYEEAAAGNYTKVNAYLDKMLSYQQQHAGASMPSSMHLHAERLYNSIPCATILFMVCLTMGFLTLFYFIAALAKGRRSKPFVVFSVIVMSVCFLALTLCESLRWIISGTIPMSNGYETMLLMAWMLQLLTLFTVRRFPVMLTFGFLLSGFFLLVSHISQMDPQIGHLMPVLRSPLLTVHVSIIMMSFALLSLTFICGLTALTIRAFNRHAGESIEALAMLSRLFLYPALTTLGLGIFIGAVWANISWGTYWSWDPKETWALITFMVYAIVAHVQTFPVFRRPVPYHVFVTFSFLTILMTYFGVNYFLGGMHSYA